MLPPIGVIDRAAIGLFLGDLRALTPLVLVIGIVIAICCAMVFCGRRAVRPELIGAGLGGLALLGVIVFTALIRPQLDQARTLKFIAPDIAAIVDGAPIYALTAQYELSFYLGRKIPKVQKRVALPP